MRPSDRWIRGPLSDGALAWSWAPFAVAGHLVEGDHSRLSLLVGGVLFLSFAHQPLTFPLVYGSPWRLATHRRLFLWFPITAVVVIWATSRLDPVIVAVVGGLWNAEHTLMQRYGIARIYGRKAGDDQGGTEKWMFLGWLTLPLLWVAARGQLPHVIDRFGNGTVDANAAQLLARMSTEAAIALPVVLLVTGYLTARWLVGEYRLAGSANRGKWLYVASTAALFVVAAVDPVAGVVGFVASHAVEYFTLVDRSVMSEARHAGALGRVSRLRHGRLLFFAAYAVCASGLFVVLYRIAPPSVLLVSVLTIGAVHFFYDAFIWKLRRPDVAASLGATQVEPALVA